MSADAGWPDERVFTPFNTFEETYKTIESQAIKAAILIPKDLQPGNHPVIINIHGGFLTMGSSLFAPFFSLWLADLAVKNRAIIISADYRLLPTLRGAIDPLQDLEDFWQWTRKDLDAVLERRAPGHSVDLGKLMITGGSAGGYFGLQVALSHPDEVSVLAIQYPYVDVKDKVFTEGPGENDPTVLRWPKEQIPEEGEGLEWVEDARMKMVSKAGFERSAFNISLCTYGQFYSKVVDPLGLDVVELEPLRRIEAGAKLPKKIWILHGDDDATVYVRQARKFVALAREKQPQTEVRYDEAKGEDHGFDLLNPEWEKHAVGSLEWVKQAWLHE